MTDTTNGHTKRHSLGPKTPASAPKTPIFSPRRLPRMPTGLHGILGGHGKSRVEVPLPDRDSEGWIQGHHGVVVGPTVQTVMTGILDALEAGPAKTHRILARAVDRSPKEGTFARALEVLVLTRLVASTPQGLCRTDLDCPECGCRVPEPVGRCQNITCSRPCIRTTCAACAHVFPIDPWPGRHRSEGELPYDWDSWVCPACLKRWEPDQFWTPGVIPFDMDASLKLFEPSTSRALGVER